MLTVYLLGIIYLLSAMCAALLIKKSYIHAMRMNAEHSLALYIGMVAFWPITLIFYAIVGFIQKPL